MKSNTRVIIPIKKLEDSKTSFSEKFTTEQRKELTISMLKDMLNTIKKVEEADPLVITPDEKIEELMKQQGIPNIKEPDIGLNKSLDMAIEKSIESDYNSVLILPGDLPLISSEDIEEILEMGESSQGVVLTPSKENGTNTLFLRPPDIIDLRFGGESFFDHMREATERDITPRLYRSENLERDMDRPEDLAKVEALGEGTETHDFLREFKE